MSITIAMRFFAIRTEFADGEKRQSIRVFKNEFTAHRAIEEFLRGTKPDTKRTAVMAISVLKKRQTVNRVKVGKKQR